MVNERTKFKQTEIGMIPEDWEVKKLGEVVNFKTGKLDSNCAEENGKYPFFTCAPKPLKINSYSFNCEAVLLAGNNADGVFHTNWYTGKFDAYQRTYIITTKNNLTFLKYVLYQLNFRLNYLKEISQGTATKFLTMVILNNIKIPFPPITEQSAIAKILSDLDSKIELNQQMNKTLESIGQAIFKRWFIDFEFPNEKGKPYKSSGGEMVDSELGEIPKGWTIIKIGDYGIFKNGINYLRDEKGDTEFFIANVRDIANNKLLLKNSLDKIDIDLKKAEDYLLNDKDILIARSASPGEVSLVLGNLKKVIYSGFSIRYRLNNPNNYLYIFLIMQRLKENLSNFAVGTTLQSVNQETLKNMKFVLPPDKVLKDFNKIIEQILEKTYNNLIQNSNLSQIRDSLLPRLMSGKIRVPVEIRA